MTKLSFFTFTVIVLLFSTLTVAEIKSFTISDDSRPTILIDKFRFTQTGHVTISLSSVSLSSSPVTKLGFVLLSDESISHLLLEFQDNVSFCILDSHYIHHLFTFTNQSEFVGTYLVTYPNEYSLFLVNCVPETKVSMKIKTEMYNLDPNGFKDYLSIGLTRLPGLYLFSSLCYLSFLILWGYFCYKNMEIVQRVHLLMCVLILMKTLSMICFAEVKHNVRVTGLAHGWNIPFYVFRFFENVLFFAVIVLIGTGWSLSKVKQEKQKKKKLLLMVVIPVQVLANIASIVIDETGVFSNSWVIWNQIYLLADITSCGVVIFTMLLWLSSPLRRETSKTTKNLAKLPIFRTFYGSVIVYLVFTRIGVVVLKMIVEYEYLWVSYAAEETASLVFYVLMFCMFRPMKRNEYFGVDEEGEEAEEFVLKKEELEL